MKSDEVICASWQDDEGQTDINLEKDWKKIIQRADEISASEDNESFSCYLVIVVLKKKSIVSRLTT